MVKFAYNATVSGFIRNKYEVSNRSQVADIVLRRVHLIILILNVAKIIEVIVDITLSQNIEKR